MTSTHEEILELLLSRKVKGDDGVWRAYNTLGVELPDPDGVLLRANPGTLIHWQGIEADSASGVVSEANAEERLRRRTVPYVPAKPPVIGRQEFVTGIRREESEPVDWSKVFDSSGIPDETTHLPASDNYVAPGVATTKESDRLRVEQLLSAVAPVARDTEAARRRRNDEAMALILMEMM